MDPNFAPAYAALGRAYVERLFTWDPRDDWDKRAEAAVDKALALDPNLAEAHASRGALLFTPAHGWQFEKAIQECQQAIALDPNLAEGHLMLSVVFNHVGLLEEGLRESRTAAAIDPVLPGAALHAALALAWAGKFQDALKFLHSTYEDPFMKVMQVDALWQMGRDQEARDLFRQVLETDPQERSPWIAGFHALLLAESGQGQEAEKRIERVLQQAESMKRFGHFHHISELVAEIYAQLHKPAQAVTWLDLTAQTGFPCYPLFEHSRALGPIRQDPRFIAFMQKLKPQWEALKVKYGSDAPARSAAEP